MVEVAEKDEVMSRLLDVERSVVSDCDDVSTERDRSGDVDKVGVGAPCERLAVSVMMGVSELVGVEPSSDFVAEVVMERAALCVAGVPVRMTETV